MTKYSIALFLLSIKSLSLGKLVDFQFASLLPAILSELIFAKASKVAGSQAARSARVFLLS